MKALTSKEIMALIETDDMDYWQKLDAFYEFQRGYWACYYSQEIQGTNEFYLYGYGVAYEQSVRPTEDEPETDYESLTHGI